MTDVKIKEQARRLAEDFVGSAYYYGKLTPEEVEAGLALMVEAELRAVDDEAERNGRQQERSLLLGWLNALRYHHDSCGTESREKNGRLVCACSTCAAIANAEIPEDIIGERLLQAEQEAEQRLLSETCHADADGDCEWENCPQLRDGEPVRSGRHCPLDFGIGRTRKEIQQQAREEMHEPMADGTCKSCGRKLDVS